jgi:hypothetical protein
MLDSSFQNSLFLLDKVAHNIYVQYYDELVAWSLTYLYNHEVGVIL